MAVRPRREARTPVRPRIGPRIGPPPGRRTAPVRLAGLLTGLLALVLALVLVAPNASAAAPPRFVASPRTILGDVDGDGLTDRITLGHMAPEVRACAVRVDRGLPGHGFTAATPVTLPWIGDSDGCPDIGTVLPARRPGDIRLAVTWFAGSHGADPLLQVFKGVGTGHPVLTDAVAGMDFPSFIGSQDFDGDGVADIWESSDEGAGFQMWTHGRHTFGPAFALGSAGFPTSQFTDLDHRGGVDVLLTTQGLPGGPRVEVVDGLTRRTQVLDPPGPADGYQAAFVDLDHDGYLDIRVTPVGVGAAAPTDYLNRTAGGQWHFVAVGSGV